MSKAIKIQDPSTSMIGWAQPLDPDDIAHVFIANVVIPLIGAIQTAWGDASAPGALYPPGFPYTTGFTFPLTNFSLMNANFGVQQQWLIVWDNGSFAVSSNPSSYTILQ